MKKIGETSYLIKCTLYDRSTINLQPTIIVRRRLADGEIDYGRLVKDASTSPCTRTSTWAGLACGGRVGGNSLFVAFIDSESVVIAILWRLSTPTVGINSLGLISIIIGDIN